MVVAFFMVVSAALLRHERRAALPKPDQAFRTDFHCVSRSAMSAARFLIVATVQNAQCRPDRRANRRRLSASFTRRIGVRAGS